ncbi:MAG: cobalamin-binding protein [Planctomycetes bacterium]|nr:cobalamin-binding protein [Planctomycetota bacterium]
MRIVSLIASSTEIVCALGLGDQLVARSHECDYPEWVRHLPAVTEPKFPTEGTSLEIDGRVKAIVEDGLSVYRVHADRLRALAPDVIVTQSQCEVCAVSEKDVQEATGDWLGCRPRIISLAPDALAHVWRDICRVASTLGVPERGEALVRRLEDRIGAIAARAHTLTARPTVACIEWIEPLMAAGNWVPELVERAGGVNLFGEVGRHSPWVTWEALVERDPDVVVVLPCGFDIARSRSEMPALGRRPEWPRLQAVRNGRVVLADGNAFFNRPGPRLVESLEILAEVLHPAEFDFGHEGKGWERFEGA